MSMILDVIVEDKRKRLPEHKSRISEEAMKQRALAIAEKEKEPRFPFYQALRKPGLSIIGEFKKASPSHGEMQNKIGLTDRIEQYNEAVDAISCLTEEDHFRGDTDIFREIHGKSPLPMIRKDFIIDEYQIYEAKVIGASAILLIMAILDDDTVKRFYDLAYSLHMDVLVETHDEEEMARALRLDAKIIGINNRNLKTFQVSLETTRRLAAMVPEGHVLVSESGVSTDEDIVYLRDCGADALLIGTVFMESENPRELGKRWKALYERG